MAVLIFSMSGKISMPMPSLSLLLFSVSFYFMPGSINKGVLPSVMMILVL